MSGSIFDHLMNLPLFQWDLLKGKQIFQESQVEHFFTLCIIIEDVKCYLQAKSCYCHCNEFSFSETMVLDRQDSFQLHLIDVLFYHAAYSLTYFSLCRISHSMLFTGLMLSPLTCSDTVVILPVAGVIQDILYRKENSLLYYGFIINCFPSPVSCTLQCCQYKLLLAGLCIFIPTLSVISHRADVY